MENTMGHIPEDENFEEFMDASAEEWSEPEEPAPVPESEPEPTNRWGSPIPDPGEAVEEKRWGSEPAEPEISTPLTPAKKNGSKWWIIAIIVVVVLCLCLCLVLVGLPLLGISIFGSNLITY
jgi:hypothetical protein